MVVWHHFFLSVCVDCRGAFRFEMLCNGLNIIDNRYFTFQMIIDIAGTHSTISDAIRVGSPVIITIYKTKLTYKYTEILEFSTRVGTITHR